MATEEDYAEHIEAEIQERVLAKHPEEILRVGRGIDIIQNCTFVPDDDGFKFYLGHAETDISLYTTSKALSSEIQPGSRLKLWQTSDKEIRIPFAVVEVKRTPTTDAIRSRDLLAREMKQVFPFLGYFFIADDTSKTAANLWRHGKHFDGVFIQRSKFNSPNGPDTPAVDRLVEDGIIPHLEELENLEALPG